MLQANVLCYLLFITTVLGALDQEEIVVPLGALGSIKGLKIRTAPSNIGISNYNAFYGIPYAHPPLGNLRFRPTKLLERLSKNEDDVFDATDAIATSKARCPQMSWVTPLGLSKLPVLGQEDCLTLNIYTPLNYDGKSHKNCTILLCYIQTL